MIRSTGGLLSPTSQSRPRRHRDGASTGPHLLPGPRTPPCRPGLPRVSGGPSVASGSTACAGRTVGAWRSGAVALMGHGLGAQLAGTQARSAPEAVPVAPQRQVALRPVPEPWVDRGWTVGGPWVGRGWTVGGPWVDAGAATGREARWGAPPGHVQPDLREVEDPAQAGGPRSNGRRQEMWRDTQDRR